MTEQTREPSLSERGRYRYSSLGSAIAGQAAAAASHMSYPDLMRTRLFEPLGMSDTAIEADRPLVEGGTSQTGLPVQPWVTDAYGPWLGRRLHHRWTSRNSPPRSSTGTAPGMSALEPTTATDESNTRVGDFWNVSSRQNGRANTAHAGQTGGYASYLGIDRSGRKAVIVLSDVANNAKRPRDRAPHRLLSRSWVAADSTTVGSCTGSASSLVRRKRAMICPPIPALCRSVILTQI